MMLPRACHAGPFSILIVEDEPCLLDFLDQLLRLDRHTVGLANDVESALQLFKSRTWDLVLTDLDLPGLNGEVLAHEIKRISPGTAVIMLTGFTEAPLYPGVDILIHKPFTRASIAEAIARALRSCRPLAAAS